VDLKHKTSQMKWRKLLHNKRHRWLDQASYYRNSTLFNLMSFVQVHILNICVITVIRKRAW